MTEHQKGPHDRIAIAGATPMGLALASVLDRAGKHVTLWSAEPLPSPIASETITVTSNLSAAVEDSRLILVSVGSQSMREAAKALAPLVRAGQLLVSTTKGFELTSLATMSRVLSDEIPAAAIGVLSGPNMMADLLAGQPAGIVVASSSREKSAEIAESIACEQLFVYANDDLAGVELAGALKNVVVVAVSMAMGLGYTANVCAWVLTRAVAEMTTLAVSLGARRETFAGLAGLGDVFLTCTSPDGVNRKVGFELGAGRTLEETFPDPRLFPESVHTLRACRRLIEAAGLDLPIARSCAEILERETHPSQLMKAVARYSAHDIDREPIAGSSS